MGKYDLKPDDIKTGINRILSEAFATSNVSDAPTIEYIAAGPGAGKTAIERYLKCKYKSKGERAYDINSDKIATFHPKYEDALEELPDECYKITRQFVRPAAPKIFDELRKYKISIINENTLDKGISDIEIAKKFKESGYRLCVNIMATNLYESMLSCYEREANTLEEGLTPRGCSIENQLRMHDSFINGVKELERLGLLDEINVYVRGANKSKPPILKYQKGSSNYENFVDAIHTERTKQIKNLLKKPEIFLERIEQTKKRIMVNNPNKEQKQNSINGLNYLRSEFLKELAKENNLIK